MRPAFGYRAKRWTGSKRRLHAYRAWTSGSSISYHRRSGIVNYFCIPKADVTDLKDGLRSVETRAGGVEFADRKQLCAAIYADGCADCLAVAIDAKSRLFLRSF